VGRLLVVVFFGTGPVDQEGGAATEAHNTPTSGCHGGQSVPIIGTSTKALLSARDVKQRMNASAFAKAGVFVYDGLVVYTPNF